MRRLLFLAGAIAFALLPLVVSSARADFIPWNYGTISGANGTFGEDKTYGGYIATMSGSKCCGPTIWRMKDEALTSSLILVLHPYPGSSFILIQDQGAGIGAGDTGTAAG
jgi:hypothetical protein